VIGDFDRRVDAPLFASGKLGEGFGRDQPYPDWFELGRWRAP
jgi:hypothetical protein